jgi:hypothetical protein
MTFNVIHYEAPLPALGLQTTAVIIENLSIVATCAFSHHALEAYYFGSKRFIGRFKAIERAFFVVPQERAKRALLELAVLFRSLDDIYQFSARQKGDVSFGTLFDNAGRPGPLPLREVTNKVIHAKELEWDFKDPTQPLAICTAAKGQDKFNWTKAEIRITALAEACAGLAC